MTDSDFLPGALWHALASPQRVEIVAADAARVWYETLTTRQGNEPRRASFHTVTRTRFEARFEPAPEPPAGSVAAGGGKRKSMRTGGVHGPSRVTGGGK